MTSDAPPLAEASPDSFETALTTSSQSHRPSPSDSRRTNSLTGSTASLPSCREQPPCCSPNPSEPHHRPARQSHHQPAPSRIRQHPRQPVRPIRPQHRLLPDAHRRPSGPDILPHGKRRRPRPPSQHTGAHHPHQAGHRSLHPRRPHDLHSPPGLPHPHLHNLNRRFTGVKH